MKALSANRGKTAKRKSKAIKTREFSLLSEEAQPLVMLLLVVVVFLCFANSVGNEFVFDDIYLVAGNKMLRSLNLPLLLSSYRPLRDISYAIDFAIWGGTPFGFHFTNIVIHSANVLLVFALVRRLSEDFLAAILAALIFAVHPIQTDAVTYISGRRDILFSLFYLSSFHCYLSYYRSQWSAKRVLYFVGFLLLWMLSLLSKEMAVSLPILIFVWHFCDAWNVTDNWQWSQLVRTAGRAINREKILAILLVVAGIGFTFYWVVVKGASQRVGSGRIEYWGGSFLTNMMTAIRVHAWYLKQLVFPTPIAQYLGVFEPSQAQFEWRVALSLLLVGGVLVYGFFLLNRDRLMAFAIFSYFVFLLPVSQIIPHHELLADHYLYLPMMSFGLFVALLVRKLATRYKSLKKPIYAAFAIVVIIFAVMTVVQNKTWKNERVLWAANLKAAPNSPRAALNLGNTYQESDPAKAEALFKRALALNPTPDIRRTLNDRLAVLLIQQGKFDEAEFFVRQVLERSPEDFFGHLWLSQIYRAKKDCDKANEAFSKARALAVKPREVVLAGQEQLKLQAACRK